MPVYKYEVLTKDGAKKYGVLIADDCESIHKILHSKNYYPIAIKKVYFLSRKVNVEELLMFFMHIDFQLKCGVLINDAIESFIDFHGNKILNTSLIELLNLLKNGSSISESFEKCSHIFNKVIIGLLHSAERTGQLSDVITNILHFLKLQTEWKSNVRRAVGYPIFIVVIAILVLCLCIGILGPQVLELGNDLGSFEPSFLTKFSIEMLPKFASFLGGIFFILCLLLGLYFLNKKNSLYNIILKIPKLNALFVKISMWQFCKIMHISLDAKLDFIQSMDLAIDSMKFKEIKQNFQNIRNFIADGYRISDSFLKTKFISSSIAMAIYVGEEGNNLPKSFEHISSSLYGEILFDIKKFGRNVSVGLTIFTGLIFVFILCSLFYPIYNYVEIAGV